MSPRLRDCFARVGELGSWEEVGDRDSMDVRKGAHRCGCGIFSSSWIVMRLPSLTCFESSGLSGKREGNSMGLILEARSHKPSLLYKVCCPAFAESRVLS